MKIMNSDEYYVPQHKKRRVNSCSDHHQQQQQQQESGQLGGGEVISNRLLSFLDIETSNIFILDKEEISGGICVEIPNEENFFNPNYEQEKQIQENISLAKHNNINLSSLEHNLTQCSKVNEEVILKLLKVTTSLKDTKVMNNHKLKHQDIPHKEVVRVIINHIAQIKDISLTVENLKQILHSNAK